jgi:hypothetical protein
VGGSLHASKCAHSFNPGHLVLPVDKQLVLMNELKPSSWKFILVKAGKISHCCDYSCKFSRQAEDTAIYVCRYEYKFWKNTAATSKQCSYPIKKPMGQNELGIGEVRTELKIRREQSQWRLDRKRNTVVNRCV